MVVLNTRESGTVRNTFSCIAMRALCGWANSKHYGLCDEMDLPNVEVTGLDTVDQGTCGHVQLLTGGVREAHVEDGATVILGEIDSLADDILNMLWQ